jgi:hypothetical protein
MAQKYKCSHAPAKLENNDYSIDTLDKLECGESVISVGRLFIAVNHLSELLNKLKQPIGLVLKQAC